MIAIYALIFRILSGERYIPSSEEDTKTWIALLAAVPPGIGFAFVLARMSHEWPLFLIWLTATAEAFTFLVLWFVITKLPGIKSIGALALLGWITAFGVAIYINR